MSEVTTFSPNDITVSMTEKALDYARKQLSSNSNAKGIVLGVKKSGCSGFMYETLLSDAPETDDKVFEFDQNVHIFVPNKDMPLLNGTEIDFIKVGLNSMFQFKNPNVKGECGCGESFTVTEE